MDRREGWPRPDAGQIAPGFLPYVLQADAHRVDLWSSARLPYDGKGWKREMRDALGAGLKAMTAEPGRLLHAIYTAVDDGQLSDVENVLFYNVGSQHFRHLMLTGVRFERAYANPIPPVHLAGSEVHHHTYTLADATNGFSTWICGETFAHFQGVRVASIAKPGTIWAALRSRTAPPTRIADAPRHFALRLRVTRPSTWPGLNRSAADLIKTLVDGIVSAFHSHDNTAIPNPAQAKNAGLGEVADLGGHLTDERWAALGPRRLWWPIGDTGIQWNPADDYCIAAEIVLHPTLNASGWALSGSLHDVTSLASLAVRASEG